MPKESDASPRVPDSVWPWLALLRFVLALLVVVAHLRWYFRYDPVVLTAAEFGGVVALFGFLVISGYSIRASLFHPGGNRAFYVRRFLRIYPLYFCAVVLTHILNVAFRPALELPGYTLSSTGWATSLGNALLLQGYACTTMPFNPPIWTISVEAAYYALAPLLLLLPLRWTVVLMGASFGFFCLPMLGVPQQFYYGYDALRHLWAWVFGFHFARLSASPWAWLVFVLSFGTICLHPTTITDQLAWVTVVLIVVTFRFAPHRPVPPAVGKVFLFLGDVSYPLYVFHAPLLTISWAVLGLRSSLWAMVFLLSVTVALLLLIDYFLTGRVLRPWMMRTFASR